jgi:hypothetical protein
MLVMFGVIGLACHLEGKEPIFRKRVLQQEFFAEGASGGDFNGDGEGDIVSGPWIYWGPTFSEKHAIYEPKPFSVNGYSDNFFAFAYDVDGDKNLDVIFVGFPGAPGWWQKNPGGDAAAKEKWQRFETMPAVDNESPIFGDLTGDGKPEVICAYQGTNGYFEIGEDPTKTWTFRAVTPKRGYQRFTHGLGIGDVNDDGRTDLLEKDGWWEHPQDLQQTPWKFHAFAFSGPGGAQMHAVDLDGDGRNEVVTSLAAHGYGLAYYKKEDPQGDRFTRVDIMTDKVETSPTDLAVSQLHAVDIADINADRVPDIVTGKRWWAHNGGDAGENAPALLIWFETVRTPSGLRFVPNVIDGNSGVGTQVQVFDLNSDKRPDIVVGSKRGVFALMQSAEGEATEVPVSQMPVATTTVAIQDELGGFRPAIDDKTALNFDFEKGSLDDWQADGGATLRQPADARYFRQSKPDFVADQHGDYWIATEKFVGDKTTGTLVSRRFRITHPWASFLVGGGNTEKTSVELRDTETGDLIFHAMGSNSDLLKRVAVDLSSHQGKTITIHVIDAKEDAWGHIAFDDFRFHAEKPKTE